MKKLLVTSFVALSVAAFGKLQADPTNLILNGDFSVNGAQFDNPTAPGMDGNGQIGVGGDPDAIADWSASAPSGTIGIEFPGDNPPYGPNLPPAGFPSATDPKYFVYLQNGGSEISQTVDLTAGDIYTLTFYSAPRGNDNNGLTTSGDTGAVELLNATAGANFVVPANTAAGTDLTKSSYQFVATGGTETLVLENTSPSGDNTVDFSKISLVAGPEPSTYAMLGLGLGFLLLALRQRRASRA